MEVILTTLAGMFKPDERFIMHRYYSTRLSMIVGMILLVIWFNYELFVNHNLRLDLVIVAGVMAVTKVLAMLYFRITH
ncbi:MAG: hypothetical protein NWE82_01790 [Candidatus Bathyarchaeota archaeon]|nr:hypothetical protein [Candidatus Bathyarchaeota archaeon]